MYSDYHIHSFFSFDSEENPENNIKQAIKLGMKQLCFTDHQDFNWPVVGESPVIDFDSYFSTLPDLREKYRDSIEVLIGIELGLMESTGDLCKNLLEKYSFDFVIGSCHIVENMDPYVPAFWKNKNDKVAFESYFKTMHQALKSFHQIDALGHMDYIVRYCPNKDLNYFVSDYLDYIDEILKLIIQKEIKLEINTANLAKNFDFPNPHTDILKRYRELGGNLVTIGSDAHKAANIGYEFSKISDLIDRFDLKVYEKKYRF